MWQMGKTTMTVKIITIVGTVERYIYSSAYVIHGVVSLDSCTMFFISSKFTGHNSILVFLSMC